MLKFLKILARMLIMIVVGLYVVLNIYAAVAADGLIFQPPQSSYRDGPGIVKVKSSDGNTISAIYLKNPDAHLTILFSHGNAEDIGNLEDFFVELRNAGFNVFGYDYQGYGTSQGKPTENHTYEDELAAYNYLIGEAGVPPSSILIMGHSVGTGPAIDLASKKPVGGLMVISGFVSAYRVLTVWPILPFDEFNNRRKIRRVHAPVLIMHGRQDNIIPFWHGEQLYEAANQPKRHAWIENASHNDITMANAFLPELKNFTAFVEQNNKGR